MLRRQGAVIVPPRPQDENGWDEFVKEKIKLPMCVEEAYMLLMDVRTGPELREKIREAMSLPLRRYVLSIPCLE